MIYATQTLDIWWQINTWPGSTHNSNILRSLKKKIKGKHIQEAPNLTLPCKKFNNIKQVLYISLNSWWVWKPEIACLGSCWFLQKRCNVLKKCQHASLQREINAPQDRLKLHFKKSSLIIIYNISKPVMSSSKWKVSILSKIHMFTF